MTQRLFWLMLVCVLGCAVAESTPFWNNSTGDMVKVLNFARQMTTCGKCPYIRGGLGPCCPGGGGYDCSGLMMASYTAGGYSIPRTAADQQKIGRACVVGQEQPGDLLFVGTPAYHVVCACVSPSFHSINMQFMYAGDNQIYECPHPDSFCRYVRKYAYDGGCRRVVG